MKIEGEGCLVRKASPVRLCVREDDPIYGFQQECIVKGTLVNLGSGKAILEEDILFPSPSSAASFVNGKRTSGLSFWKTSFGMSLGMAMEDMDIPYPASWRKHR